MLFTSTQSGDLIKKKKEADALVYKMTLLLLGDVYFKHGYTNPA